MAKRKKPVYKYIAKAAEINQKEDYVFSTEGKLAVYDKFELTFEDRTEEYYITDIAKLALYRSDMGDYFAAHVLTLSENTIS